jgi:hypothetical protein
MLDARQERPSAFVGGIHLPHVRFSVTVNYLDCCVLVNQCQHGFFFGECELSKSLNSDAARLERFFLRGSIPEPLLSHQSRYALIYLIRL